MRRRLPAILLVFVAVAISWTGSAAASTSGGVSADESLPSINTPSATRHVGGAQFGAKLRRAQVLRPRVTILRVRTPIQSGTSIPRISLRIDEPGLRTVRARVAVLALPSNRAIANIQLGRISTGRTHGVHWPRSIHLSAGQYLVRVHARDRYNHVLQRLAHTSGRATLVVTPAPVPVIPPPTTTPTAGSVLPGGVFPVAGPHGYGDPFGAPRKGYSHQGQDVTAAEGTPVVAPVAGTITITSYQASAAGYYVVEQANDGRSFFFAHCQKGSFGSAAGTVVAAGAPICRVGHTGDATGPHLHFEEWLGGYRVDSQSQPVDPLPQLRAWDRGR